MLLVEQNLDLTLDLADRIVVMEKGRMVDRLDAPGRAAATALEARLAI